MTNDEIKQYLLARADKKYLDFSARLVPGCATMLGVRIPELRKLAKELAKGDFRTYLAEAKDDSFEEIMLQGMVIGYAGMDIVERLSLFAEFMPKNNDWSINDCVCATMKAVQKERETTWKFLMQYKDSPREFDQRVVAVMLMDHFLVDDYIDRVLAVYDLLKHEGYYRMMGVAWGIATAYAKYPEKTHAFLLDNHLDDVTYNKAIQKMLESNRVSDKEKQVLRGMKRV